MSPQTVVTAGQRVLVDFTPDDSIGAAVQEASGRTLAPIGSSGHDLRLTRLLRRPQAHGLEPVARGVWRSGEAVFLSSAGGSGFAQRWRALPPGLPHPGARIEVASTWSPSPRERLAAHLLPQRHRALRSQVLLHHPALWAAVAREGLSPLHVSVLEVEGVCILLAGPGGVGKSSLVADALAHGAHAVCDNLGVSDGDVVHGVVEALRLPEGTAFGGGGARAAHHRREHAWTGRVECLRPQLVVVVRRDDHGETRVTGLPSASAARALVAGTYAAGELQRFWPLVAQLALGGLGPAHPPLQETAYRLTNSLPCFELTLGVPGSGLDASGGPTLSRLQRVLAQDLASQSSRKVTP